MKYKDLFTGENAIFTKVFEPEYPTEYRNIFGSDAPEKIDAFTVFSYGNRTVVESITENNAKDVISAIIALNVQRWEREAKAMLAEYEVISPVTLNIERTETVTLQESKDNTETGANKAFNDVDFSDSDRKTENDERNRTETHKGTETAKGLGNSKSISSEIVKEMRLRRENWKKSIIFALVREFTLDIYE